MWLKTTRQRLESWRGRKCWWLEGFGGTHCSRHSWAESLLLPAATRSSPYPVRSLSVSFCFSTTNNWCYLPVRHPDFASIQHFKLSGTEHPPADSAAREQVFPQPVWMFVQLPCLLFRSLVHSNRNQISDPFPSLLQLILSQVTRAAPVVAFGVRPLFLLMAHFICHQAAHSSGSVKSFGSPWLSALVLADLIYVLCHLQNVTDCW